MFQRYLEGTPRVLIKNSWVHLAEWVHADTFFALNSADWNLVNSWAILVETTSNLILRISTEFQGDCFECERVITMNPWVELVQTNSILIIHIFSVFQRDLEGTPRVLIKNSWVHADTCFALNSADWNLVNSWAILVETTSNVILRISTEFQGDCFECERVIRMNPWVELVQTNSTLIIHIFSVFQRDLEGTPRVLIKNAWVHLAEWVHADTCFALNS